MSTACTAFRGAIDVVGPRRISMVVKLDGLVLGGHYPGFPILPGVCIVEFAHRGALAAIPDPQRRWELSSIDKVRFTMPVYPGDSLTADLEWCRNGLDWSCTASVATQRGPAAQVRISFTEKRSR